MLWMLGLWVLGSVIFLIALYYDWGYRIRITKPDKIQTETTTTGGQDDRPTDVVG